MDGGEKDGFWGQRGHETEKVKRGEMKLKINRGWGRKSTKGSGCRTCRASPRPLGWMPMEALCSLRRLNRVLRKHAVSFLRKDVGK